MNMTVLAVLGVLGFLVALFTLMARRPTLVAVRTVSVGISLTCLGPFVLILKGDKIGWLALALGIGLLGWGVAQIRAIRSPHVR
ncbi:MAG TPA: hypothetical protein VLG36_04020 [Candidatus Chromulinivoraceae bacterium]|nr:hypothetical protein [Candidatus Chromulinivoraceae bacterium]